MNNTDRITTTDHYNKSIATGASYALLQALWREHPAIMRRLGARELYSRPVDRTRPRKSFQEWQKPGETQAALWG